MIFQLYVLASLMQTCYIVSHYMKGKRSNMGYLSFPVGPVVSKEKMFENVEDDDKWMMSDECLAIL